MRPSFLLWNTTLCRSTSQCWRVVGVSSRDDRVIRASLQDISLHPHSQCKELLLYDGTCVAEASRQVFVIRQVLKLELQFESNYFLTIPAADPNINDTIVAKCSHANGVSTLPNQVVFSTQPVLFVKWATPTSGKIVLQLVKLTGNKSLAITFGIHITWTSQAQDRKTQRLFLASECISRAIGIEYQVCTQYFSLFWNVEQEQVIIGGCHLLQDLFCSF